MANVTEITDGSLGPDCQQELFRMEKSVMTKSNFDELALVSGDRIPEALLEYICYEHQYNLFGYGVLDPAEFARTFKFSRHYLMSRHESPYQLQLRRILKDCDRAHNRRRSRVSFLDQNSIVCGSRLENALFILAAYPLNVTSTTVSDDKTLVRQYGFLRVIESFSLRQNPKTGKVIFSYKLDDKFRRNLSSLYLTTRRDSFVALRKSGLGLLYVFLLKLRDALFAEGRSSTDIYSTPDFEYLCSLASVNMCQEAKYRKRDLNLAFSRITKKTELEMDVEWVKGGEAEKYVPLFHFTPTLGFNNERAVKVRRENERTRIALLEFKHNLVEMCPLFGDPCREDAEDIFFEWIATEDPNQIRNIGYALEKTFVDIGCGIPSDIDRRLSLFSQLARSRDRQDLDHWMREIFSDPVRGFQLPRFRCIDQKK